MVPSRKPLELPTGVSFPEVGLIGSKTPLGLEQRPKAVPTATYHGQTKGCAAGTSKL